MLLVQWQQGLTTAAAGYPVLSWRVVHVVSGRPSTFTASGVARTEVIVFITVFALQRYACGTLIHLLLLYSQQHLCSAPQPSLWGL